MRKWSLSLLLLASLSIMLLMLLSIIFEFNFLSDTFSSVEDNSHDLALFCNKRHNFSSLFWSHRGSHKKLGTVDGDSSAISLFFRSGVYHFDVDISLIGTSLLVAHPSRISLEANHSHFSSLEILLSRLSNHLRFSSLFYPKQDSKSNIVITIEPKFELSNTFGLESLLTTVMNSSISSRVAIIVSSPKTLTILTNCAKRLNFSPNIAIAFRSIPKSPDDFKWSDQIEIRRTSEGSDCTYSFRRHLSDFFNDNTVQVNMPDVALLRSFFTISSLTYRI